jgi:hypothetical protein
MKPILLLIMGCLTAGAATPTRKPLYVAIHSRGSRAAGTTADREFTVGERAVLLSAVRSIEQSVVMLTNSTKLTGPVSGLESVEVLIAGIPCTMNLLEAERLTITAGDFTVPVGSAVNELVIKPPSLPRSQSVIKLPAPVNDVVVGGGGRYLILYLGKLQRLAIFDVNAGRITKFLQTDAGELLLAANMDRLIVVYPQRELMQRWNLQTLEKEVTVRVPVKPVRAIAMGYASAGPLALNGTLIDPYTMNRIRGTSEGDGPWGKRIAFQASGDGRAFGGWSSNYGYWVGNLNGDNLVWRCLSHSLRTRYTVPSFDGRVVCTSEGAFMPGGMLANSNLRHAWCLPAVGGNFYVAFRFTNAVPRGSPLPAEASVRLIGNNRISFPLPPLKNLHPRDPETDSLTLMKRLHVIPQANLIVAIALTCDRLILREFDVEAELDRAGVPYLFVNSVPIPGAQRGTLYEYQIDVRSRDGGVHLTLDSGPAGMALSTDGKLTWPVPAAFRAGETPVIVRVQDVSGQQIFHAFHVRVR